MPSVPVIGRFKPINPYLLVPGVGLGLLGNANQDEEVPSYQDGGIIDDITSFFSPEEDNTHLREQVIEPIRGRNRKGRFIIGEKPVDNLVQYFNNDGTYSVQGLEEQVLNSYRMTGIPEQSNDINIFDEDYNDFSIRQTQGEDVKGKYVDLTNDNLFKGEKLSQRVYFPDNFNEQMQLEKSYDSARFSEDLPMTERSDDDFEKGKDFMIDFVESDNYLNMLRPYYDDPEKEQKLRLEKTKSVEGIFKDYTKMEDGAMGYTYAPGEDVNAFQTSDKFDDHDDFEGMGYYDKGDIKKFEQDGSVKRIYHEPFVENDKVFLSNKQVGDSSVHEISHNIKTVPKSQYKDIFNRVKRTLVSSKLMDMGDNKTFKVVDYLTEPTEVISRLDRFRQLMSDEGIKDQRKNGEAQFNEADLIKAFKNKNIKSDFNIKQLIDSTTSSQDLLWLLNNIVDNNKEFKQSNMS